VSAIRSLLSVFCQGWLNAGFWQGCWLDTGFCYWCWFNVGICHKYWLDAGFGQGCRLNAGFCHRLPTGICHRCWQNAMFCQGGWLDAGFCHRCWLNMMGSSGTGWDLPPRSLHCVISYSSSFQLLWILCKLVTFQNILLYDRNLWAFYFPNCLKNERLSATFFQNHQISFHWLAKLLFGHNFF
jgi:hypothetical protein